MGAIIFLLSSFRILILDLAGLNVVECRTEHASSQFLHPVHFPISMERMFFKFDIHSRVELIRLLVSPTTLL